MIERKVGEEERRHLYSSTHEALELMRLVNPMTLVHPQGPHALAHHCPISRKPSWVRFVLIHWHHADLKGNYWLCSSQSSFPLSQGMILTPSTAHQSDYPSAPYLRSCRQPWWYRRQSYPPLSQQVSTSFITLPLSVAPLLTFSSITSTLRNPGNRITESLTASCDDIASRVSDALDALADGVCCGA